MVGGGTAALAGLVFVAMSINPENIIRNTTHKNRAINMLSGCALILAGTWMALRNARPAPRPSQTSSAAGPRTCSRKSR